MCARITIKDDRLNLPVPSSEGKKKSSAMSISLEKGLSGCALYK